jgi:hypothetical protein
VQLDYAVSGRSLFVLLMETRLDVNRLHNLSKRNEKLSQFRRFEVERAHVHGAIVAPGAVGLASNGGVAILASGLAMPAV